MATYGELHAGDIVRGADAERASWSVARITRAPQLAVTLHRHGQDVTAWPPAGMPVEVLQRSDVAAEFAAGAALINAFGNVELIEERWET